MIRLCILLIYFVLYLSVCSIPDSKIYTLQTLEEFKRDKVLNEKSFKHSLNIIVDSPRYLTQPYIVTRYSDYQIEIARYSKWETNPKDILSKRIKEVLESLDLFREVTLNDNTTDEAYLMRLDLKRFEMLHYGRDYYGEITVDIDFISPEGKRVYADRLSKRIKLKDDSFTELAKELSNALNEIIETIKTEIPKVNKQL